MLDTAQYEDNKALGHPELKGRISAGTLEWIGACGRMAAEHGAQLIAVMHHNLMNHSSFIQEGFTVEDHTEVMDALVKNGVRTVLSGHIHMQDISEATRDGKPVYDIASSALSVYPHQYGLLHYSSAGRTLDYSTATLGMEPWAATAGITDPKLLHFKDYSEQEFRKRSAGRTFSRLASDKAYAGYSDTQLGQMADVVGALNALYTAGMTSTGLAAILDTDGYRLWQTAPASGTRSYVLEMAAQQPENNRRLHTRLAEP